MGQQHSVAQVVELENEEESDDAHLAAAAAAALGVTTPDLPDATADEAQGKQVMGTSLHDYKLEEQVLGEGGFGKVRLATNASTGHKVAVKIIKRDRLAARSEDLLAREVKHHELLRHEHIVRLYTWIKTPGKYYLVMELCTKGDLLKHSQDAGTLTDDQARTIFTQLLEGLKFCHGLGVMHRDLKLENVMLAEPPEGQEYLIKIADFGLSDLRPFDPSVTYCGSPLYAAPELMDGNARAASPEGYDASRSDMWSCGVILYALLTSNLPFDGYDMTQLIRLVIRAKPSRPIPKERGQRAIDLVNHLITRQPTDRLSAAECLEHAWITGKEMSKPHELRAMKSMPSELPSTMLTDITEEKDEESPPLMHASSSASAAEDGADLSENSAPPVTVSEKPRGLTESSAFFRSLVELRRDENLKFEKERAAQAAQAKKEEPAVDVSEPEAPAPTATKPRPGGRQLTLSEQELIKKEREKMKAEREAAKKQGAGSGAEQPNFCG